MAQDIRVLIADDEDFATKAYKGVLKLSDEASFLVKIVDAADKVVDKVRDWRPHVILLDDKFKDKAVGISELLPRIRGEFKEVAIVIITAHRGGEIGPIGEAAAYDADGFIDKISGKDTLPGQDIAPETLVKSVLDAYKNYQERGGTND